MDYTAMRPLVGNGELSLHVTLTTRNGVDDSKLWEQFAEQVEKCVTDALLPALTKLQAYVEPSQSLHSVAHSASYLLDGITVKYKLKVSSVADGDIVLCELARKLHKLSHLPHLLELTPRSETFLWYQRAEDAVTAVAGVIGAGCKRLFPALFNDPK